MNETQGELRGVRGLSAYVTTDFIPWSTFVILHGENLFLANDDSNSCDMQHTLWNMSMVSSR